VESWFEDGAGRRADVLVHGEPGVFAARVRFHAEVEHPLFGVALKNEWGDTAFAASTMWTEERTGAYAPGDEVVYRVRFETIFAAGRHTATPAVARRGQGVAWIDRREDLSSVVVTHTRTIYAAVDIPYEIALERTTPAPAEAQA
jgi:hypothetical protein